jgi:integrase
LETFNELHGVKDGIGNTVFPKIDEFSIAEFTAILKTTKVHSQYYLQAEIFRAIVNRAIEVSKKIAVFNFPEFEKLFFRKPTDGKNAFTYFDEIIKEKTDAGAISTAEKYELAKKSYIKFLKYSGLNPEKLDIYSINKKFLEQYESYCTFIQKMSVATIGIYLRNLRAVYRIAIEAKEITMDYYPFGIGEGKYQIPTSDKVNKSLDENEVRLLWGAEPENDLQAKAKDFWFFSYFTYGMNVRDICELKHTSVEGKNIFYVRAKTKNTKKKKVIKQVPVTKSIAEIIKRQKDKDSDYLFGIIDSKDNPKAVHEKIRNFNKFINKHFREFAISAGIDEIIASKFGTYHARHSFATIAVRKGNSMELISEILHDGNIRTTQSYLNSFPKETFQELSKELEIIL